MITDEECIDGECCLCGKKGTSLVRVEYGDDHFYACEGCISEEFKHHIQDLNAGAVR